MYESLYVFFVVHKSAWDIISYQKQNCKRFFKKSKKNLATNGILPDFCVFGSIFWQHWGLKLYFTAALIIYFTKNILFGDHMTNKKRFLRDGIMLSAVTLITRSVAMTFSAFLAGAIGSEGVGLFTLVMTVYSFALTLATSGVGLAVTRLVAASPEDRRGALSAALLYSSIFGAASCLILLILSPFICHRLINSPEALPLIRILALTLPAVALSVAFNGYFVGVRRVRSNALTQIFGQIMRILLSYALVSAYGGASSADSLRYVCIAILITELSTLALIAIQYLIDRILHKSPRGERGSLSSISSVALPLALSQYVRSALISVEHMLIPSRLEKGGLTASEALSGYGILHGMALPAVLLPMAPLSSFSGLLVPEFAHDEAVGNTERISRITSRAAELTLTYAALTCAVILFFADELGAAVYSSAEAGRYLRFLAPVIPIMYLDHVSDQILKGIGEQVYSMWVNIADSFLSIILVFFLLPRMGVVGYAVVIIVMEAFNFLMSYARLRTRINVKIRLIPGFLLPLLFASFSCAVSGRIFLCGGDSFPLICKILFAICLFVFFDRICDLVLCNIHKSKKTANFF